jgi:hypothetical protein
MPSPTGLRSTCSLIPSARAQSGLDETGPGPRPACVRRENQASIQVRNKGNSELSMAAQRSRKTSKRTAIQPHRGDRRYVTGNNAGQFKKEVNVGRSLAADRRKKAKTKVAKGQGDRGDTNRTGNVVKQFVRKLTSG